MLMILGAGAGIAWGAWRASKAGGNRLDVAQHAAVGGIIGALLGLFATLALGAVL